MSTKNIIIIYFSICFGLLCMIFAVLFMVIAKDLSQKVDILEQEIIDYKWQLEQVDQMICIKD